MYRAKWQLFVVMLAVGSALAGCANGQIINASTVGYYQLHGEMPKVTAAANAGSKQTSHPKKKARIIPVHLSASTGLGDTQAFIEQSWGKPSKVVVPITGKGSGSAYYKNGRIFVQYVDGRAADLTWKTKIPVSVSSAEQTARAMLPKDAVSAQTITAPGMPQMIEQWTSLSTKYVWQTGINVPGYITVAFAIDHQHVSSFEISLGEHM